MRAIGEHPHTTELADDIARCVHCGFCLQACPTYLDLGMETDSPRGRIALIEAVTSGRAEPTNALLGHLDSCLQCRACETACPSGVQFGRIMETARAEVIEGGTQPLAWRLRVAALRATLPHPRRLGAAFAAMRLYQRSPAQRLLRGSAALRRLVPALMRAEAAMPDAKASGFVAPAQPAQLTRSVGLLVGCVMPHLYARTHEATIRVLNHLGYRVFLPSSATCCGALNLHAGDRRFARELARRNIDAFDSADVEAIIVNSAGCGSTMKEYGELFAGDAVYTARAHRFASMTKDVLEFVAEHDLGGLSPLRERMTYQDSCHLVHAQKVTRAPRTLLHAIPELDLREMSAPDRCCGSAGIYSIVQPQMSQRLLDAKMDDIATTGATTIATANPGCMMQLENGIRQRGGRARVVHVVELIDESLRAAR